MTATETATVITVTESAGIAKENAANESVMKETAGVGNANVGKENVTGTCNRRLHHHRLLLRRRVGGHRLLRHPDEKFSTEIKSLRHGEGIFCRKNFFLTE